MYDRRLTVWNVGAGAALFGLLLTGMWAELDRLGPVAWALGAGLLLFARQLLGYAGSPEFIRPTFGNTRATNFISFLLLIPLSIVAALSWGDDFPFSGDHDHHMLAIAAAARFWTKNWLAIVGFGGVSAYLVARPRGTWWPFAVFAAMIGASFKPTVPVDFFARYPATLYTLAVPFHLAAEGFGSLAVWKIDHLINLLAPVVWLFGLRPLLFGRTARWGWIVGAVFMLTQREALYFFDIVTLDAWPMVLVLTAFEALFHADDRPWLAPLIAGLACAFRDVAVLVFLVVGLASAWRGRRSKQTLATVVAAGTLGVLPFLIYYLERRAVGVWRTMKIAPVNDVFTAERLANLQYRLVDQFGWLGCAAFGLVVLFTLGHSWRVGRLAFGATVVCVAGGLAQFYVTFADEFLLAWPGYAHLTLLPLLTLIAPTQILPTRLAVVAATAIGLGQLPTLGRFIATLGPPAYTRNFTEDFATPIYVPIRETLAKATLTPGQTVRWIVSNDFEKPFVLPIIYPDLSATYRWESVRYDAREDQCRCAPGLALFVTSATPRNLRSSMPYPPFPAPLERINPACLAAIEATCRCQAFGDPTEARICTNP